MIVKSSRKQRLQDPILLNTWKNRAHVIMALPAFLVLFLVMYVPMVGLILAFQKFSYSGSVFGGEWVGFENFKYLIQSKAIFQRATMNTIKYYVIFTALGTFLNVCLAIAIDQFMIKKMSKVMQTIMIVPVFISYAAVTFIVEAFMHGDHGLVNAVTNSNIQWYSGSARQYWPLILTLVKVWKDTGYGSVLYMSVLAGIDAELYEAAQIDGAGKWRQIIHITLPSLVPMITVMLLLSVGNIMHSDTGLFYQVTRDSGVLYATTQVIDSYVLHNVFKGTNWGYTAAASLFQSVVGLALMLFANWTVRKLHPEDALF